MKKGTRTSYEIKAWLMRQLWFKKYVLYKKCVGIKVIGCGSVCADGEIFDENEVEIGIIPKALNLIVD